MSHSAFPTLFAGLKEAFPPIWVVKHRCVPMAPCIVMASWVPCYDLTDWEVSDGLGGMTSIGVLQIPSWAFKHAQSGSPFTSVLFLMSLGDRKPQLQKPSDVCMTSHGSYILPQVR